MSRPPQIDDFQVRVPWLAMVVVAIVASQIVTAGFFTLCYAMRGDCQLSTSAMTASLR
jgi:hypothetical protein